MRASIFYHRQASPSATWTIEHNSGSYINVDVTVDDDGTVKKAVPLEIKHVDSNTLQISFSTPRVGTATIARPWRVDRTNVIPFTP
jgi:hypothetical protein